ncbi:MAG TPA: SagB family peptide dehydrogenase [Nitrososphaeraceae archaeon]|nr:SagB family peptide dehydrogenase [Nitrososphaeraceae archaeon]
MTKPKRDFLSTVLKRRSNRVFKELSKAHLSKLLWYSSKVISLDIQKDGSIWFHRPIPSAGGLHPIDLIVYSRLYDKTGHFYYYNPLDHSLGKLLIDRSKSEPFLKHIEQIIPLGEASIVWFVANGNRTYAKYHNPESLLWRDAGAYIYCFQLVSEALNINSCPLGTLGQPFITDMLRAGSSVFGVGGMLIGGRS